MIIFLTDGLFLNLATTRQWSRSQTYLLKNNASSTLEHLVSIRMWSMWIRTLSSGQVYDYLWNFRYGNSVFLNMGALCSWELGFMMWQIALHCYNYHKYCHLTFIP